MKRNDFVVLAPDLAEGTWRLFARRQILRYRHPAVMAPADFMASLASAFGATDLVTGYVKMRGGYWTG